MKKSVINKENYGIKHIAFIMDGNGRWAKLRGRPRTYGHQVGFKTLFDIALICSKKQIEVMSVYAFSTENWNRPEKEISFLFSNLEKRLDKEVKKMNKENIRLSTMGELSKLPLSTQKAIDKAIKATEQNTGMIMNICLNYGGRDEIVRATKKIISVVNDKILDVADLNETTFSNFLDSAKLPEVDLLIRTSGEQRLSNFMMWQLAYAEFVFNEHFWPEYNNELLEEDIAIFAKRTRRFGGIENGKQPR